VSWYFAGSLLLRHIQEPVKQGVGANFKNFHLEQKKPTLLLQKIGIALAAGLQISFQKYSHGQSYWKFIQCVCFCFLYTQGI
jgi:hypothetical protein